MRYEAKPTEVLAEVEQQPRGYLSQAITAVAVAVILEAMAELLLLVTSLGKAAVPTTGTPKDF